MTDQPALKTDWRTLWASGDLALFCFVSLGILLHATMETMIATIMPAMVKDLAGVTLVGWTFAVYELGAIVAGAAAGRLVSYVSLRSNMVGAAVLYGCGALICALAPTMPILLGGRLIEGLGGGALVALAFVSVERLFPRTIWPQLFAIMSAVWGVAAFGGPLLGALISTAFGWRWAFGVFTLAGFAMAAVAFLVLRMPEARRVTGGEAPPFPYAALATLAGAVILIAVAGVEVSPYRSTALFVAGVIGLALFFRVDARM